MNDDVSGQYLVEDILEQIFVGISKKTISTDDKEIVVFIKHPSQREVIKIYNFYTNKLKEYIQEGIMSEKEQLSFICDNEWWSKDKENEILYINNSIKRLEQTKKKLIYNSDKKRIITQITELKNKLLILNNQKSQFLSLNAESLAAQDSASFFIENFIFLDENFNNKPTIKDSDDFFNAYFLAYNEYLNDLSNDNIKKAALSIAFQNMISISSGSCMDIFGKPVIKLTKYQSDLLMWGNFYQNLIKNCKKEIPNDIYEDPDKFVEWYESINNIEINKKNNKKRKSNKTKYGSESKFLFGERDDIKKFGEEVSGDKILKDAEKSGGNLNIYELMEKK